MTNRFLPIHLGAPGEEISKKDLYAVAQRFKHFNQLRLQHVQSFLQPRQQDFLKLLPLLFHQNHPLLPGFVSLEGPAGIPDYTPNKQTIDVAKQFSKGFVYKRKALRHYPIQAIFLMGSVGSMAFSKNSDIDIWLCHSSTLAPDELNELRQKAQEVEKWAATLKIETHFFLVDAVQFLRGENTPISKESSGETQHYLLLEEFYRTSIYIAGRIPVWWLVPPQQEKYYKQYVAHLLENRFISETDVVDFGGLEDMPMAEFVSATLWHIYKSLTSPHKSLLKLLLMESYASEFPEPQWLCLSLKQAVYQGDFSVESLDPYLLMYRKVDAYLRQAQSKRRLNLIRECFYMKIMAASDNLTENRVRLQREDYLHSVADQWEWPEDLLDNLASQKFWDIKKASVEHVVIRDQLQQCLRMILKFSGLPLDQAQRENRDLKLIGRKLRATLDLRPDKIEVLTTRTTVHAKPDLLIAVEVLTDDAPPRWCLYDDRAASQKASLESAIKSGESLLEVLCWAVVNGLYKKSLNLQLVTSSLKIANNDLYQLFNELNAFLSRYLPGRENDLEVYGEPNRVSSSLLLINLGESLAIDANNQQLVMSERSDPLSYGDSRQCFIQSIQRLSVSSWGEASLQRYIGIEGVFNCLVDVFNNSAAPLSAEKLQALCYNPVRGKSIILRIESLFGNLLKFFASARDGLQRYIVAAETGYGLFQLRNGSLGYYRLDTQNQLLHELAKPNPQFSAVFFDAYVLDQTYIPSLYTQNLADVIQVFYHATSKHVGVYVLDEKGALFVHQHSNANPEHVITHYSVFLDTLLARAQLPDGLSVKFYEIQRNSAGVLSCQAVPVKLGASVMDLRVRIATDEDGAIAIYCNEEKFSVTNVDSFKPIRAHILGYRKNRDDYPFHITEIDVPCRLLGTDRNEQLQAAHFLNYKQKIEDKLNI
ncbi:class I adenylate cyclase [Methylomonas sp. EFPC1]|uniref:class I adenylate cyclase n=1 Tax=Methylomonas sp. EFPC1 TaxID=2812647 RepID=UPI0019673240|nr:class I adenylate cyclase [Methylomonas sp. EFPC1]QSB03192.1 class I adenylate cyclase [Methylomonas sp. EFPC1]